jgi:hypothetical protein
MSFLLILLECSCDNITLAEQNVTEKTVVCYNPDPSPDHAVHLQEALLNVFNAGGRGLIYAQQTTNLLIDLGFPYALVDFQLLNTIYSPSTRYM